MSHFNYEICELRRRPVGRVVALSLLFAPIFLRRTHVILHLGSSASPNSFKMKMKEK
ncbi:hypothetical protein MAL06_02005 [Leptospira noguchii]|nr:hypothetical protein [Leptospira noguchii]UOG30888.1 hypothetical protein MAL06_02005 [Leptospira noguchii]